MSGREEHTHEGCQPGTLAVRHKGRQPAAVCAVCRRCVEALASLPPPRARECVCSNQQRCRPNSAAAPTPTPTPTQLTQGAGSSGVGQRNVVGGGLIAVVCGGECGVCGVHERGQRGGHICQQAASSGHLCVSVPPFTPCGLHRLLHTFTQQTASPGGGRGAAEQQGAGAERQEESGGLHVLCGGWLLAGETRRAPRGEMSVREWRLCLQRSTKRA